MITAALVFFTLVLIIDNRSIVSLLLGPTISVNLNHASIKVAGSRCIVPGDYVVNDQYGIGRYLGVKSINIARVGVCEKVVPAAVVQYKEGEITWFQRFVDHELFLYRTSDSGDQTLSSIIDQKKWEKKKLTVQSKHKRLAIVFTYLALH